MWAVTKGRLKRHRFSRPAEHEAIEAAFERIKDPAWRKLWADLPNPYYKPHASQNILQTIKEQFSHGPISLQKPFHLYP